MRRKLLAKNALTQNELNGHYDAPDFSEAFRCVRVRVCAYLSLPARARSLWVGGCVRARVCVCFVYA